MPRTPVFARQNHKSPLAHNHFIANILTFLLNEFIISHSNVLPEKFSQNFRQKNSSFFSKKYFPCSEFIYLFFIFLYNFFGVKHFSQKSCRKFFGSMQYLPINSVFYIFQQKYIHQRLGSSILGRRSWFLICAGMKLYFYLDFYKVKAFKDLVLSKEKKSRTPNRDNRMSSKQSVISSFGACLQKLAKIPWKLPQ